MKSPGTLKTRQGTNEMVFEKKVDLRADNMMGMAKPGVVANVVLVLSNHSSNHCSNLRDRPAVWSWYLLR